MIVYLCELIFYSVSKLQKKVLISVPPGHYYG